VEVIFSGTSTAPSNDADDTLTNIEGVIGSKFSDILDGSAATISLKILGNDGDDIITGGSGADYIEGGDGNDMLDGGEGADVIDGGIGSDIVSYQDYAAGVEVAFAESTTSPTNSAGDTLVNIEGVIGSQFDDTLDGSAATIDLTLFGYGGNDVITGGLGFDQIDGGGGDDIIHAEADELVVGGEGDDTIYNSGAGIIEGGQGMDTFFIDGNGVEVRGGDGDDIFHLSGGGSDIQIASGGAGDDVIFMDGDPDVSLDGPALYYGIESTDGSDILHSSARTRYIEFISSSDPTSFEINLETATATMLYSDPDVTHWNMNGSLEIHYGDASVDVQELNLWVSTAGETVFSDGYLEVKYDYVHTSLGDFVYQWYNISTPTTVELI
jgi:Ca2+-binding RTX toxin-like protein